MWWSQFYKNMYTQKNFSGGAVDKNRPANARGHRFDPCSRKIPHCMEQLSPCATTTEPVLPSPWATITEAHMPRTHALQWEARRVAPTHLQLEKALTEEQCCLYIYISMKKGRGNSLVRTLCFHCKGHRFDSWLGKKDPTCCAMWKKIKRLEKDKSKSKVTTGQ